MHVYMLKSLHGAGPSYLSDCGDLILFRTRTYCFWSQQLQASGPSIWNLQPIIIRDNNLSSDQLKQL